MQKPKSYVILLFSPLFLTFFFIFLPLQIFLSCPPNSPQEQDCRGPYIYMASFLRRKGKRKRETITAHQNNGKNKYRDGKNK